MKMRILVVCCSIFLLFAVNLASAEGLFTDDMVEEIKNLSISDMADDFVIGMIGVSKEEFVSTVNAKELENICIVLDRIADMCEYSKSYFALELNKKDESAAASFIDKEINVSALDLSQLSYQELLELKDHINLAIWESEEWQEVTVPQGVWKVGEDIPAGHWSVICAAGWRKTEVSWGEELSENGQTISWSGRNSVYNYVYNPEHKYFEKADGVTTYDFEVRDGDYIVIDDGECVFMPYNGKPSLGFK